MIKKGRPKLQMSVWDKKYYTLDYKRDKQAHDKVKQERLYKGYVDIFRLTFEQEPNQKAIGIINKAVSAIIDRI